MTKKFTFQDGSQIEWVDKENYRYSKDEYSTLIWVDIEAGFFNSVRIIKTNSITKWQNTSKDLQRLISNEEKLNIVIKLSKYFDIKNQKYRIEDQL